MCNIQVFIPILDRFLYHFSLCCGCIIIFIWTLIRSFFCMIFFTVVTFEILIGHAHPIGTWFVPARQVPNYILPTYHLYISMLLAETVLIIYSFYLMFGIIKNDCRLLEHYLVARFTIWSKEIICLLILCLIHKLLIGWYLILLLFVILETYSFVVVYSYYVKLRCREKSGCPRCSPLN